MERVTFINVHIRRIILEYIIDNMESIFSIANINTLSWYINMLQVNRDCVVEMRGFQRAYLAKHIDVAKWINKKFHLTAEERKLTCQMIWHNIAGRHIWNYHPDPMSLKNRRRKGIKKVTNKVNNFLKESFGVRSVW